MTKKRKAGNLFLERLENISKLVFAFVASRTFLRLVFVWFLLQAVYMSFSTATGIAPDETYHLSFIRLFTENGWSPFLEDQASYYSLGAVVDTPFFLYHYLLSLPHHLFAGSEHALLFLRLFNVVIGAGSLYLMHRIGQVLRIAPLIKNLSLFMMSSTMMFVFLSASVNYDNLFIFLSLASILMLFLLIERFSAMRLLLLGIFVLSGLLIKISFLPIAAVIAIILSVHYFGKLRTLPNDLKKTFASDKRWNIALSVIFVLLTLLFVHRYVGNLIKYQNYLPNCTEVLTVEQCRENAIFRRGEMLDNTPRPPATRNMTEYLADWVMLMQVRTYGIFGHKRAAPTVLIMLWVQIWMVLSVIAVSRKFKLSKQFNIAFIIMLVYLAALIYENYGTYQHRGIFELAVQGRYAFAVLPLIYLLSNHYILELFKRTYLKSAYVVTSLAVFAFAALPSYIFTTTPDWHNPQANKLNSKVKSLLISVKGLL